MEMKVQLFGAGVGIPKTKLGFNFGSGCWFGFRHTPKSMPIVYAIVEEPDIGRKDGQLVAEYVETEWFSLLVDKNHVIPNVDKLAGKIVDFHIETKYRRVDFTFKIISPDGDVTNTITKMNLKSTAVMLAAFETRGELRLSPKVDKNW